MQRNYARPATCSNCLVFRAIFSMFDADRPIFVSVTTREGKRRGVIEAEGLEFVC